MSRRAGWERAFGLAAWLLPCALAAADPTPAPAKYAPDAATYLLMHFDGDLRVAGTDSNTQADAFGGAVIATNGWAGACLDPGTGGVRVAMTQPYDPPYGRITLEARVFLREYPKTRGYIIDKLPVRGTNVGAAIFVDSTGRLGHEVQALRNPARTAFLAPEDTALPLNRWVHVMVVNAPWPVSKFQMYVDRQRVLDSVAEHRHGIFHQGDREASGCERGRNQGAPASRGRRASGSVQLTSAGGVSSMYSE